MSASGYEDGLGRRTLEFDRETGGMLERLHLRPELWAFEGFLRERVALAEVFDDERFARVRGIERSPRYGLNVVSQFVPGNRLCDLLEAATNLPADEASCPSVDAALGFLLEILPALNSLHAVSRHPHGTLGPGRIVLTEDGRVIILDAVYGQAIERLQFNRARLWLELGLAAAPTEGPVKLDVTADIAQASLVAMMIVLGRPLRDDEYPDGVGTLLTEVIEIAQIRGSGAFASGLQTFLSRTLPLASQHPHGSAEEAVAEVRHVAREIGVPRCRAALTAFVGDMNRVLTETREPVTLPRSAIDDALDRANVSGSAGIASEPDLTSLENLLAEIPSGIGTLSDVETPDPLTSLDNDETSAAFETSALVAETYDSGAALDEPPVIPADPPVAEWTTEPENVLASPVEREAAPELPAPAPEPVAIDQVIPPAPVAVPPAPVAVAPAPVAIPPAPIAVSPTPIEIPSKPEPVQAAPMVSRERDPLPVAAPSLAPPPPPPPPLPAPAPVAVAPEPVPEPPVAPKKQEAPPPPSKRKRRGGKPHRDKLRSIAVPKPPPPVPVIPMPVPLGAVPLPKYGKIGEPLRQEAGPIQIAPVVPVRPIAPKAAAPLRLKTEAPAGYNPVPQRSERREFPDVSAIPYVHRRDPESAGNFPWRLAAAAVVLMIVGIGAGRVYLSGRSTPEADKTAEATAAAPTKPVESSKVGTLALTTQPAGARVLLDGKTVGETPVTLTSLAPGKHALTLLGSSGSVKKVIRIEAGKTLSLEVPIYSGWIAVFAPIPLDIAENGRAIGTTDQGRLMLSPGLHQLTLSNRQLGYKGVQIVDIEPGEERSINIQPTGALNANAVPWAEVWMAGKKVGETPIAGLQVPLGTHEILFKNPQFPDRRVTVTVMGTGSAVAAVDFTK
jgi:hypothetical protein